MKAAILHAPDVLCIEDVPEPVGGEYDALCAILASGICSGTDTHAIQGDPFHEIEYPALIGHEGIGRVIACGKKVRNFRPGDMVTRIVNRLPPSSGISIKYGWGAFAQRGIVVDWKAMRDDGYWESKWRPYTFHQKIPRQSDPVASTMIITWRETLAFFRTMKIRPRDALVIIGSGANALAFTDHARNVNCDIAVIGNEARTDVFLRHGALSVYPYHLCNGASMARVFGDLGIHHIIDAVGSAEIVNNLLPCVLDRGHIGIYGLNDFMGHEIRIHPAKMRGTLTYHDGRFYEEGSAHAAVMRRIKEARLLPWGYLSREHVYPLERIEDALAAVRDRRVMKSVVRMA